MRSRVVLYCGLLAGKSPEALSALIIQAAHLDLNRVRAELEQERISRESLFERRVCPTARRVR